MYNEICPLTRRFVDRPAPATTRPNHARPLVRAQMSNGDLVAEGSIASPSRLCFCRWRAGRALRRSPCDSIGTCDRSCRIIVLAVMDGTATPAKAGVRLDVRENAVLPADSGAIPIVPGKPRGSELVRRIFNPDASEVMPPPAANKPLTEVGAGAAAAVDRRGSQVRAALGVHRARAAGNRRRRKGAVAAQCDRQLHPGPAGTGGAGAVAAGRMGDAFPAAVAGLDRAAPGTGRCRRL